MSPFFSFNKSKRDIVLSINFAKLNLRFTILIDLFSIYAASKISFIRFKSKWQEFKEGFKNFWNKDGSINSYKHIYILIIAFKGFLISCDTLWSVLIIVYTYSFYYYDYYLNDSILHNLCLMININS